MVPPKVKGFTLIELLLVVGIMGVLLVYTVPQFVGYNQRSNMGAEAQRVVEGLKTAQMYALSNTQNATSLVDNYRVSLLQASGDPAGCYRGYQLEQVDSAGNVIAPVLDTYELTCPIVLESTWRNAAYETTTGTMRIDGVQTNTTARVWYSGQGYRELSIDKQGRVQLGGFTSSVGVSACSSACGPLITPTNTPAPTNTPVPTNTPTPTIAVASGTWSGCSTSVGGGSCSASFANWGSSCVPGQISWCKYSDCRSGDSPCGGGGDPVVIWQCVCIANANE
ncbi:hypothetical protein CO180_02535 [candidate division WWE3 bacterium CG_4_9_14_3_um_filter_41_6]|uniref:Prepilin-type N-terminal cleavage/methylation domain-containing protein n=1 Tax=candidate division WWE3 bacterium CG_4_10_14_0_2_um_filter_41_14 TaxID=1975072 RepID=A0A2M7TJX9_UNCKA|nr:MAG: hypothetical protein COY32_02680 [candidate division WWE3 bacterium CG_4_10_14_0_2_um_filter_41_14]PJA38775.1 MAG: hypothetical protein CO180_02535 [candidate division WWE3 bacterium CG_4_9_14_3_um_filter_41_6]